MVDYNNLMDYMEQLDPDELIEVMNDVQKVKTASGKILYCPVYDKREKQLFQRYQETNNVNFISEAFAMEVKRNKNVNMYGLDSWIKLSSTTHYPLLVHSPIFRGTSCWLAYGSWSYNYLCNQCLRPLKLCVRIPRMARCTRYSIM
jgi:hypothetical protein